MKIRYFLGDDTNKTKIYKIATQLCGWQMQASTADITIVSEKY